MTKTVTLIPGDGITSELVDPVLSVLEAAKADVFFESHSAGCVVYGECGETLPDSTVASIKNNGVALKGKLCSRPGDPYRSPNWELRRRLGLFASVIPLRNLEGLPSRHRGVDIVVIREASEDIYGGLEHTIRDGIVASLKVVTAEASRRISRFAFEYARKQGRKKVTLIHKANIMKVTDGLFIECADEVSREYDDIEFNKLIVDNACMQLLLRPGQFDVMLMGNLYGGIMSDLGAGIVGGISASMGASFSNECAVFESIHGDAPHLAGTGRANPLPFLLPACSLLEHLGQESTARRIRGSITRTLRDGIMTPDIGGDATTAEMTGAIITNLE